MIKKSSYYFILLSIPLYVCYLYVSSLFIELPFQISSIVSFSMFVVSVVMILTIRSDAVKAVCFFVLHICFVLPALLDVGVFQITKEQINLYFLYGFPSLLFFGILSIPEPKPSKKNENTSKKNNDVLAELTLVFYAFLVLLAGIIVVRLVGGKESINIKFGKSGALFLLSFLFFLFCIVKLSKNRMNEKERQRCSLFLMMLCSMSALNALTYVFCLNQYSEDYVQIGFPLFLAALILFDNRPVIKEIALEIHS